jgi:hypothetical protein
MPEFAIERDAGDLMAQKLAASVISDILDAFGFRDQVTCMTIRPLFSQALVVGRAMPVKHIASGAFFVFASGRSPLNPKGRLRVFAYRAAPSPVVAPAAPGACNTWGAVSDVAVLQSTRSLMRMEQRDREMSGHPGEGG